MTERTVTFTVEITFPTNVPEKEMHIDERLQHLAIVEIGKSIDDGRSYVVQIGAAYDGPPAATPLYPEGWVTRKVDVLVLLAKPSDALLGEYVQIDALHSGTNPYRTSLVVRASEDSADLRAVVYEFTRAHPRPDVEAWRRVN